MRFQAELRGREKRSGLFLSLIERQANCLAGGGAAGDGLGEPRIMQAGGKVGEFDGVLLTNGAVEIRLDYVGILSDAS